MNTAPPLRILVLPCSVPRNSAGGRSFIVGLGNPCERYERTPHNLGFDMVDRLSASLGTSRLAAYPAAVHSSVNPLTRAG